MTEQEIVNLITIQEYLWRVYNDPAHTSRKLQLRIMKKILEIDKQLLSELLPEEKNG